MITYIVTFNIVAHTASEVKELFIHERTMRREDKISETKTVRRHSEI
jgi:hypothetical protein